MVLATMLAACASPVPYATTRDGAPPALDAWAVVGGGGVHVGGGGGGGIPHGCLARLLVIFDRSGSMAETWTGTSGTAMPKWQVAETALASALEPHASRLTVGAILFPSRDAMPPMGGMPMGACDSVAPIGSQIPFAACSAFLSTWTSTWASPTLLGGTPIDAAFTSADAALSGAGSETAVVLMTDGEPTCMDATSASARAATWHSRGIATFVVGLPGSSAGMTYLAAIASAGGTGAPLSADDPTMLGTTLAGIATMQVEGQCGH